MKRFYFCWCRDGNNVFYPDIDRLLYFVLCQHTTSAAAQWRKQQFQQRQFNIFFSPESAPNLIATGVCLWFFFHFPRKICAHSTRSNINREWSNAGWREKECSCGVLERVREREHTDCHRGRNDSGNLYRRRPLIDARMRSWQSKSAIYNVLHIHAWYATPCIVRCCSLLYASHPKCLALGC